ncbi:hypothetical protein KSP40_PGU006693 [Platanthera guangdongensis]|uniref:Uncharacterized protein n=1 Tax=Platanthera guangdongensis TaxID=2320717 RepID=A0ABR2MYJ2_9ASPA
MWTPSVLSRYATSSYAVGTWVEVAGLSAIRPVWVEPPFGSGRSGGQGLPNSVPFERNSWAMYPASRRLPVGGGEPATVSTLAAAADGCSRSFRFLEIGWTWLDIFRHVSKMFENGSPKKTERNKEMGKKTKL